MKKELICTIALYAAFSLPLSADQMSGGEATLTREMAINQRKAVVQANMKMDADTATKFWPLYDEYQDSLKKVNERNEKMLQSYAGDWTDMTDDKADKLMDDFCAIQDEKLKLRRQAIKKFKKTLPAKVVARYFQIENKMDSITNYNLAIQVPLVH